jgi:lipoprotein-releasing system ATP-binding protein
MKVEAPVIEAQGLVKRFHDGNRELTVLDGVDLAVQAGEMVAVVGASGSGKSSLLHVLGVLDRADAGTVRIAGQRIEGLSEGARSDLRNRALGFVYQFHHLLPEFSALDNVAMPLIVRRESRKRAREQARDWLEAVGLSERANHHPGQLSGGERQRVALARALVTGPALLLADEPTGNLDRDTARSMFDLLQSLTRERGTAMLVVTHDSELAARASRVLHMQAGRLSAQAR